MTTITAIVIDVFLCLVVLWCCISGYRKGFAHSFLSLAGFIIALVVASLFSAALSGWLNDQYIEKNVQNVIYDGINTAFEDSDGQQVGEKLFSAVDRFVFGGDQNTQAYVDQIEGEGQSAILRVSGELASAISHPLCDSLAFLLLFLAALIVLKIITVLIDHICRLPLLKQANQVVGLLFGVLVGLLYAMLLSRIFISILPWLSQAAGHLFSTDLVEQAHVLKFFSAFNLFKGIISGLAGFIYS
ncbi:MAG: CvpA family protein [Clostridiales bacterium]|nr:CvpA family protein [Clostridiales bacterium]